MIETDSLEQAGGPLQRGLKLAGESRYSRRNGALCLESVKEICCGVPVVLQHGAEQPPPLFWHLEILLPDDGSGLCFFRSGKSDELRISQFMMLTSEEQNAQAAKAKENGISDAHSS